jgi:hypothetical protein
MDDTLRRELTALLSRIIGDRPLPDDLRSAAIQLAMQLTDSTTGASAAGRYDRVVPPMFGTTGGHGVADSVANRRLVYVHGICRHGAGFSDGWWSQLQPFVIAFGPGDLNQTRLEVTWSDLVNPSAMAALGAGSHRLPGMPIAGLDGKLRAQVAASIRETFQDRADQQQMAYAVGAWSASVSGGHFTTGASELAVTGFTCGCGTSSSPPLADLDIVTGAGSGLFAAQNATIEGPPVLGGRVSGSCLDDFSVYLVHAPTRQSIIDRFTTVVRPQLAAGREIDIISHSWGTVVAYEGLRELEDRGVSLAGVRNFFTVGAALSISAVKMSLRSQNQDGRKPTGVRRWVNLNARGDLVGGPLQGRPYKVDEDRVNLDPFGCGSFLRFVDPVCAHSSYFQKGNDVVNRDIFARFINM